MTALPDQLATLGLRYTAAHLDDVIALATKRRWSTTQLLEHLVESEQQERTRRSLERRLARARIGRFVPMSEFEWAWPKRIDRPAVEAALRLDFLTEARNVVLVAPQGLGKTMIAQNIAHAAVLAGTHVLFTTAAQLLLDLGGQESTRGLARRLNHYATRGLLCVDEIGYLSYDARAADLLFQVVSRRYERKSLVLTTNLPFSDWPTVFPNAATATALIDRLVHHAEILSIEGRQLPPARRRGQAEDAAVGIGELSPSPVGISAFPHVAQQGDRGGRVPPERRVAVQGLSVPEQVLGVAVVWVGGRPEDQLRR